eukprot:TRINITY_DN11477_c0_g1_i1.p1 TRINITY_DN11477_c0_g1~~TRINITY_DN11477_c0_g1_i1.p1  ORF type:complete len:429 (+),score=66.25 TRINITY_DN11477_c0_g1_i1:211-1497(+)
MRQISERPHERALPLIPPSSLKAKLPKGPSAAVDLICHHQGPRDAMGWKAIAVPRAPSVRFGGNAPPEAKEVVCADAPTSYDLLGAGEKPNGRDVSTDVTEQPIREDGLCTDVEPQEEPQEGDADVSESESSVHLDGDDILGEDMQIQKREVSGMDLALRAVWMGATANNRSTIKGIGDTASSVAPEDMIKQRSEEALPDSRFIAAPGNKWRLAWDLLGGLLVLYDMIRIPMTVFEPPQSDLVDMLDWCTLIFWTIDIPSSFFVGYVDKGLTVMDPWRIIKNYCMGWFAIDLAVVLPDWVFTVVLTSQRGSGDSVKLLRGLRMTRTGCEELPPVQLPNGERMEKFRYSADVRIRCGKFHVVKRLFMSVGKSIIRLQRLAVAGLSLEGCGLQEPGDFVRLTEEQRQLLWQDCPCRSGAKPQAHFEQALS